MTHICVSKLTIIGSDNGLSPGRRQAITWINAGILFIEPLGTNFSDILIGIQIFSFKKMCLKMASVKWHPFCLGLNELMPGLSSREKEKIYLHCFRVPTVSQSPSFALTYLPVLLHSPDYFTVSTRCTYTDLGSQAFRGLALLLRRWYVKTLFFNENVSNQISQKVAHNGSIDFLSTLVQVITWCQTGDNPLPLTNIIQDGTKRP